MPEFKNQIVQYRQVVPEFLSVKGILGVRPCRLRCPLWRRAAVQVARRVMGGHGARRCSWGVWKKLKD
jgi:hypothetical protein